jgi:3-oxoacyl-[acyl-carrier protein] reductase
MDLGLQGKRALVMGGSRGIGRGIAAALAGEGAAVAIVSRDQAALDRTAAEIAAETGQSVLPVAADLADRAALAAAFAAIEAQLGGVDILVNNSGGPPPSGVSGLDPELWRRQFEMMVLNIIGLTDLALPGMRARRWGRVLTVASSSVIEPIPAIGISNTLRSALVGWSKTLAGEVGRFGITVNMLLPGRIATQRIVQLDSVVAAAQGKTPAEIAERSAAEIPVGRYGTIEEFGAVAAFLAGVPAGYVTGSMIRIDGGSTQSV